jgi:hypothetical protein
MQRTVRMSDVEIERVAEHAIHQRRDCRRNGSIAEIVICVAQQNRTQLLWRSIFASLRLCHKRGPRHTAEKEKRFVTAPTAQMRISMISLHCLRCSDARLYLFFSYLVMQRRISTPPPIHMLNNARTLLALIVSVLTTAKPSAQFNLLGLSFDFFDLSRPKPIGGLSAGRRVALRSCADLNSSKLRQIRKQFNCYAALQWQYENRFFA